MRRSLTAFGAVLVLGLTACGADQGPGGPEDPEVSAPAPTESAFAHAVSRVSPDALGKRPMIEFGQTAELFSLSESDDRWLSVTAMGNLLVVNKPWADSLGIDASAADYSIEVGVVPSRVGVIAGGQTPDTITDAASQVGFTGDEVLSQDLTPAVPVTVSVQQIKPIEEDVVLATSDADVGWIDGGSLFADEQVGPVAVCLGDVLAAQVAELDGEVVGIGVRAEGTDILSVICVPGGDDAIANAEEDLAGPNFADRLELIDSSVVDGLAKVTVQHAADESAVLLFSALQQLELPGA